MAMRIKANDIPAAKSREEVEALIQEMGDAQRKVERIEASMNDKLSKLKAEYEERAKPLNELIANNFAAIQAYCGVNRDNMLKGDAKTAKLTTGEIYWRVTPPKVAIRGADAVMKALKSLGLIHFIRSKEEIDKQAILADPDKVSQIKGITISQREEFGVKPFSSEIEKAEVVS